MVGGSSERQAQILSGACGRACALRRLSRVRGEDEGGKREEGGVGGGGAELPLYLVSNTTLEPQLENTHETPQSSRDEGLLLLYFPGPTQGEG